ncbi:MAG: hypothetical protein GEU80_15365 [Dehalococcoidia bacterium]|nr:hypothetical protein [Dehalococcoidia bacterium]
MTLTERPEPSTDAVHPLDPLFHPRSTAIVGVSSRPQAGQTSFLGAFLEQGYHERHDLYPVNPKITEAGGLKAYPSVLDCPDPVDHVISQVPADAVLSLADQCIQKGVRSVHLFTAGFSETGDPERTALEFEVRDRLRAAGIRMLGPNCMGLYVPAEGISFSKGFPREPGNVFVLSQSGANTGEIVRGLSRRGVRFSKAVSFGNGADLDCEDFFDYAAADPETEVVTAYIEGVKNGRAVFEALKRCAAVKPTIILKGGRSAAGARAATSHTGSLAGSLDVFEALCRQTGAIRAHNMDELHDLVIAATTSLRRARGRGVGLVSAGGGFVVLAADAISDEGLDTPNLPEETQERLRAYVPVAGTIIRNPVDAVGSLIRRGRSEQMKEFLSIIGQAEPIDLVFMTVPWDSSAAAGMGDNADEDEPEPGSLSAAQQVARDAATDYAELQESGRVPFVAIQLDRPRRGAFADTSRAFLDEAYNRGVAVYPTVARAARAVGRILEWRARREGLPDIL